MSSIMQPMTINHMNTYGPCTLGPPFYIVLKVIEQQRLAREALLF